jgi:uncharacterized protein YbjQ (UPF0145 family)
MFQYRRAGFAVATGLLSMPSTVDAQQIPTSPLVSYADGMLVTSNDVTTCPYTLVGSVSVNMRAHSYSLKELETPAIAAKLREKARKIGGEAVVLVTVGQTHMTLTSLRSTPVTGRAIRYADRSCAPAS